ncbi:MAG TPA: HEPN domain-containing protein [Acidilobales archaeon]|nr:HEPN domain-containing protein [Acidilobales archaeon]
MEELSMVISKFIIEELRRRADRAGVSIEEYLLDILVRDVDPLEGAEKYLRSAKELLEQARQEIVKGNLRQASEKIWDACALAIKAHALAKKGVRIERHSDLWIYKNEVAKELGDWVRAVFRQADSMHKNFYEDIATKEDVEDTLREVKRLVVEIAKALKLRDR